jgi:anti-anti-sigma regulatory factor
MTVCLIDTTPGRGKEIAIVPDGGALSHGDACRIAEVAARRTDAETIVIDFDQIREATTSAFARLVLLRRALLSAGRDLRLINLRDRAAHLFGIARLETVLPCE